MIKKLDNSTRANSAVVNKINELCDKVNELDDKIDKKRCGCCKEYKPYDDYPKCKDTVDGYYCYCKKCEEVK